MRGFATTLPPAFSLLRSEFNAFLYAPIGVEENDTLLTVLSALARLGLDPWQESARLALLSREKATQSLTAMISTLPNGRWAPSDSCAIAARLIALLPAKSTAALPTLATAQAKYPGSSRLAMLLIAATLGGMIFLTVANLSHPPASAVPDKAPVAVAPAPQG